MIFRSNLVVLLVSFLIVGILSPALSLRFEVQSGRVKCISEDMSTNSMTVGKYHIVKPNADNPLPESHKLTVRVTSAHGTTYHNGENVAEGQFAFTAVEAGDYMACFYPVDHTPAVTINVEFDWKTGVHAKDWNNVAKKGQVDAVESEVKKMQDMVSTIHDEMFYLRDREEEMQELNRSTNSKMAWLSVLSLFVCLSVAGLQVWHLKTFFEKKKLI